MKKILFEISPENDLTWLEMESLMTGNGMKSLITIRPIMARFLLNEAGDEVLPHDEAMTVLGNLKISEIKEVMSAFAEVMKNTALNPTREDG